MLPCVRPDRRRPFPSRLRFLTHQWPITRRCLHESRPTSETAPPTLRAFRRRRQDRFVPGGGSGPLKRRAAAPVFQKNGVIPPHSVAYVDGRNMAPPLYFAPNRPSGRSDLAGAAGRPLPSRHPFLTHQSPITRRCLHESRPTSETAPPTLRAFRRRRQDRFVPGGGSGPLKRRAAAPVFQKNGVIPPHSVAYVDGRNMAPPLYFAPNRPSGCSCPREKSTRRAEFSTIYQAVATT